MTSIRGFQHNAFNVPTQVQNQTQSVQFGLSRKHKPIRLNTETDTLDIPEHVRIPVIEGDGIGPEIMRAAERVVDAAVKLAYGKNQSIGWLPIDAGENSLAKRNEILPQETLDAIQDHYIAVKSPLNTPIGGGFRSINVALRKYFDLFANIRPVKSLPEVVTPVDHDDIDVVIFRENTEDVYKGIEFEAGKPETLKLIETLNANGNDIPHDSGIGIKQISKQNSERILKEAFNHALTENRKMVTVVHKGNIMKHTEGAFWNWAQELAAKDYPDNAITEDAFWSEYDGDVENLPPSTFVLKQRIADAMLQDVILSPNNHDVVVTMNLNGDYLSDAFAALVGGIGLAPGVNQGKHHSIFEAVHGTAPDIAGKGIANPTALILSMKLMLEHLGWQAAADLVQESLESALKSHKMTGDLTRHMKPESLLAKTVNQLKQLGFVKEALQIEVAGQEKIAEGKLHTPKALNTKQFADALIEQMETLTGKHVDPLPKRALENVKTAITRQKTA